MAPIDKLRQQICRIRENTKPLKILARAMVAGHSKGITVDTDICGSLSSSTFGGCKYFVTYSMATKPYLQTHTLAKN